MRIRLAAEASTDSLRDYLQRCGCVVQRVDERTLEASAPPQSLNAKLGRTELAAFIRVWRAMHHPEAEVEIRSPPDAPGAELPLPFSPR